MITSTGIVLLVFIIMFFNKYDYLIGILIISSIFQAACAIIIGNIGVPLFSFAQIIILSIFFLKNLLLNTNKFSINLFKIHKFSFLLIVFFIWALLSALVFPQLFEGIGIFNPKVGIDAQYGKGNQTELIFSLSNFAQVIYLFLNITTFFVVSNYVKVANVENVRKIVSIMLFCAILFSIYSLFSHIFGKIEWLDQFLYNNPGYYIGNEQQFFTFYRINGPFLEPSLAGSFFAAFSSALLFNNKNKSTLIWFFVSLSFLLLSTSTNGYIVFFITVLIFSIYKLITMVISKSLHVTVLTLLKVIIPIIGLIIIFILFSDIVLRGFDFVIASKTDSDSFLHRVFADIYALSIYLDTYTLGAGLGSNRPSSFLPSLISNVGSIGTLLFFIIIYNIIKKASIYMEDTNILYFTILLTGILLSMLIAIPDISYAMLWIFLAILHGSVKKKDLEIKSKGNLCFS